MGQQFKVEISVHQAAGRVRIDGLQNEVFEATQKITDILRKTERKRQEAQAASMLANMVQWSFLEVSCLHITSCAYAWCTSKETKQEF